MSSWPIARGKMTERGELAGLDQLVLGLTQLGERAGEVGRSFGHRLLQDPLRLQPFGHIGQGDQEMPLQPSQERPDRDHQRHRVPVRARPLWP